MVKNYYWLSFNFFFFFFRNFLKFLYFLIFFVYIIIGGLEKMEQINLLKAKLIYDVIDEDDFYYSPVDKNNRSIMNVRFNIPSNPDYEKLFIQEAAKCDLVNLAGYRTLGGMRASIYNAQPIQNCEKLAKF